jgi:hypothetical protein
LFVVRTDVSNAVLQIPTTVPSAVLAELFLMTTDSTPHHIAHTDTHSFVLYPLITNGNNVGVFGVLLASTSDIDGVDITTNNDVS